MPRRLAIRLMATGAAAAMTLPLASCWTYRPASPGRLLGTPIASLPADAWPARDLDAVRPLLEQTPELVRSAVVVPAAGAAGSASAATQGPTADPVVTGPRPEAQASSAATLDPADPRARAAVRQAMLDLGAIQVTYKGLHGVGLLRVFEPSPTARELAPLLGTRRSPLGFNATLVTSRTIEFSRKFTDRLLRRIEAQNRVAAGAQVEFTGDRERLLLDAGSQLTIPPVRVAGEAPYRGLLLHLPAYADNRFEPKVIEEFRRRGWAVVSVRGARQVPTPRDAAATARLDELQTEADALFLEAYALDRGGRDGPETEESRARSAEIRARFEAMSREVAALGPGAYEACPGEDLDPVARQLAHDVDESIAGNAYAAEAVVDYLKTQRPDIPTRPCAVVAFSAGTLGAPATVARLNHEVDAVVMIGGGVNVFAIAQDSSFTDGGLRVRCAGERVDAPTRERLEALYLTHTRLDPIKTAPLLAGLPVLQVHAAWDGIVPAARGRELRELLERPDTLELTGGHTLLFFLIPTQARRIADWLDTHAVVAPSGRR